MCIQKLLFLVLKEIGLLIDLIVVTKELVLFQVNPNPQREITKKENRGDVRVYVTHGPTQDITNEVSIKAGYDHKEQSNVKYIIDGKKKFSLFTLKDRAWAETPELDSKIVSAMKSGNKLLVSGTSSRGTKTEDTYSLFGFTASLKLIDKACGR